MRFPFAPSFALFALSGCYLAHDVAPAPVACAAEPPRCVTRASPCDAAQPVDAVCAGDIWACPDGASRYVEPWIDEGACLPLEGELDPFLDGVHEAPIPVAFGDECRWLVPLVDERPYQVAAIPASTCDGLALRSREPVLTLADDAFAGIQASFLDGAGRVRALTRGWRYDATAPFGVRDLGVGLATVEGDRLLPPPTWLFDPSLDLGDAAVPFEDHLYAYGCPGDPHELLEDCIVGRARLDRVDEPAAWSILGAGGWGAGDPSRVFGSGPHRGPVFADPRSGVFVHVYVIGFGDRVEITRAPRPEGPWSTTTVLTRCELPDDDPDAYCAGPVVYLDRWDPFAPGELLVGYSIGTTAADGERRRREDPRAYWPRIVRVPF